MVARDPVLEVAAYVARLRLALGHATAYYGDEGRNPSAGAVGVTSELVDARGA